MSLLRLGHLRQDGIPRVTLLADPSWYGVGWVGSTTKKVCLHPIFCPLFYLIQLYSILFLRGFFFGFGWVCFGRDG